MVIQFFLARVLKWIASLSWKQFLIIVAAAAGAAQQYPRAAFMSKAERDAVNRKRADFVSNVITSTFTGLPSWTVNVLRELAVAWLNREAASP